MEYKEWLESVNVDEVDKVRISNMTDDEISSAFGRLINFGTAGLRGIMDVGTCRMNKYVVSHVSQAIARYMLDNNKETVVIACDTRNNSALFRDVAINIFLLNGIKVYKYDSPTPIP